MKKSTKSALLWLSFIVVIVLIVWGMIEANKTDSNADQDDDNTSNGKEITINEDDWLKGNPDSDIVLVEYSDLQCPACGYYYPIVNEVLDEFGSHIKLVYRHFPLMNIHDKALMASMAAEAAGEQGKFFEMADLLFENQSTWSTMKPDAAKETFVEYATELELDIETFTTDLESEELEEKILNQFEEGVDLGVNATPTFYLNGVQIKPAGLESFRTFIREALDEQSA